MDRTRRAVRLQKRLIRVTTKPLAAIRPSSTGLLTYAPRDWWPSYPFAPLRDLRRSA